MNPTRLALCAALLAVTACTADTSDEEAELEVGEAEQAVGCGLKLCGTNSPILGGFKFYELDMTGTEPSEDGGLRIQSFESAGGVPLTVSVVGRRLRGIDAANAIWEGNDLVNSKLYIVAEDTGLTYRVRISAIGSVPFYEGGFDPFDSIETYSMHVRQTGIGPGPERQLCALPPDDSVMFPAPHQAVVSYGDRYNRNTGSVTATGAAAGNWFNIGCTGDSIAKLAVARFTEATQDKAHQTTIEQRTAALRMFRADFCGTGFSHTEYGIPLDWKNDGGWNYLDNMANLFNVEAIWDEDGAYCVSNPRLDDPVCPKAACGLVDIITWKAKGHMLTINPP